MSYCIVLYCFVLHYIVLYCVVLHCIVSIHLYSASRIAHQLEAPASKSSVRPCSSSDLLFLRVSQIFCLFPFAVTFNRLLLKARTPVWQTFATLGIRTSSVATSNAGLRDAANRMQVMRSSLLRIQLLLLRQRGQPGSTQWSLDRCPTVFRCRRQTL